MATLTTNISNVSLTVSGNTQQSTNISWTCPTVPSGGIISSCTLTGKATASMRKGSATITVNGQTVSSGSNFTVNLGTGNTTKSVAATAKGGNKNAAGTVTFSNLVYTVTYVLNHTVTFVDWDGTVLKTQTVEDGASATAPTVPSRTGYSFIGWDKNFTNVTSDLTVTAQYEALYLVTFVDYDGSVLKTEYVANGGSATAPTVADRFGYTFTGWSVDFDNVSSNITTMAQYKAISILNVKEDGNWVNIVKVYKRVSGNWVEQVNDNWDDLFDLNLAYTKKERPICPTAVLYSNGMLVFSNYSGINSSYGDVVSTYTGWDTESYSTTTDVPWYSKRYSIARVYLNNVKPRSTRFWFRNGVSLLSVNFNNFDTSKVTDMIGMFNGCTQLTYLDVSGFDTSNVTNMSTIFNDCSGLTSLDVSGFDTSNVTSMNGMFNGCTQLTSLDVSGFNTSKVTDMIGMFSGCAQLTSLDVSGFDTSNVTSMNSIFSRCTQLTSLDVSGFNTSKVTNMSFMFNGCTQLTSLDVSGFNTSKVTNMSCMFDGCSSLTSLDLSNFDMTNVTNTTSMFQNCTNPNLTIYVKDEATKIKIESSDNFPSTATVVIGKPA